MLGCQEDKMAFFEREDYELEQFSEVHMSNLGEKGVGIFKNDLSDLQEKCQDEVQSAIHGSYSVFVDACNGIAEVDGQFQHLRVLVAGTASLANELKRVVVAQVATRPTGEAADTALLGSARELTNATHLRVITVLEELEVAIAERDFPLTKKLLLDIDKEIDAIEVVGDILALEMSVDKRRRTVVQLLESQLQDPTLGSQDRHALLQILVSVAGDIYALTFLLSAHSIQINNDWQRVPKPHQTGESENEGAEYSAGLSQCSFHGVGLAVEDFWAVFGTAASSPLCSILSQWAESEAKKCAEAIQSYALSGFAELSSTVTSVTVALLYAQMLKNAHSIDVTAAIRAVLWPTVENHIAQYYVTATDDMAVTVREEMSGVLTSTSPWDRRASPSSQPMLDSAQMIIDRIRYVTSILRPLWSPHIVGTMKHGIQLLLETFIEVVATDLREKTTDGVNAAALDRMSEWLMTVVAHLVEDQVPKELSSIELKTGRILTTREIQSTVEKAAQIFGMEQINQNTAE